MSSTVSSSKSDPRKGPLLWRDMASTSTIHFCVTTLSTARDLRDWKMHNENEGLGTIHLQREDRGLSLIKEFSNVPLFRQWTPKEVTLGVQRLLRRPELLVVSTGPLDDGLEIELEPEDCAGDGKSHYHLGSPLDQLMSSVKQLLTAQTHVESFLNPQQRFVEVEAPRYGAPLAPSGTLLDLSVLELEPLLPKLAPLANDTTGDEDKLLSIWNYELYGCLDEDGDEQIEGTFWQKLFRTGPCSVELVYLKHNPWYKLMNSVTPEVKGEANESMIPKNYISSHHYENETKQVVSYLPRV